MRHSILSAVLGIALLVACSGSEDSSLSRGAAACVENQSVKCSCTDGTESAQTCLPSGKFSPCPCAAAAGGSSAGGSSAGGSSAGGSSAGGNTTAGSGGVGGNGCLANDCDGDGYPPPLDCDDTNPAINPGAFDFPEVDAVGALLPDQIDDDCSGVPATSLPAACDDGLGPIAASAKDAARAIGLCSIDVPADTAPRSDWRWGVIDAKWSDVAGPFLATPPPASMFTPSLDTGILAFFGPGTGAREGTRLLALSTGIARATGQPGYPTMGGTCGTTATTQSGQKNTMSGSPGAFAHKAFPGCIAPSTTIRDGIALDVRLRVPSNATTYSVRYRFFSCDYQDYLCSGVNDTFAIMMSPSPFAPSDPMSPNVAFATDSTGAKRLISVNAKDFLTTCAKTSSQPACAGADGLTGTGFESHAATGWLRTTVPVTPGSQIDLRFAIWDSGDSIYTSTVLIDQFTWGVGSEFGTVVAPIQ